MNLKCEPGTARTQARRYQPDHWLRSDDPGQVLSAYARQQAKAYSRVKNRFIARLLGDLTGVSFLDYGCGPGYFMRHAVQAGARRVVGVDAEPTALAAAKALLRQSGRQECELVCARQWPFSASDVKFEAILLKDVIEHLPDDLGLLRQAAGLLHPSGRLVVSTQNAWSLNYLAEGFVQRRLLRRKDWQGWDPTHLRFYTPRSLARLLAQAGLEVMAWRSSYLLPHKLPRGRGRYYRLEFLTRLDELLGMRRPWDRLGWCLMVQSRPGGRRSS